jgi:hypothetical protein
MHYDEPTIVTGLELHRQLLTVKGLLLPGFSHTMRNVLSNIKMCRDHLSITEDCDTKTELLADIDKQIEFASQTVLKLMDTAVSDYGRQKVVLHVPDDIAFHRRLLRTVCRKEQVSYVDLTGESFPITADPTDVLLMLGEYVTAVVLDSPSLSEENRIVTLLTKRTETAGYLIASGPLLPSWKGVPNNRRLPLSNALARKTGCTVSIGAQDHDAERVDVRYRFPLQQGLTQ